MERSGEISPRPEPGDGGARAAFFSRGVWPRCRRTLRADDPIPRATLSQEPGAPRLNLPHEILSKAKSPTFQRSLSALDVSARIGIGYSAAEPPKMSKSSKHRIIKLIIPAANAIAGFMACLPDSRQRERGRTFYEFVFL